MPAKVANAAIAKRDFTLPEPDLDLWREHRMQPPIDLMMPRQNVELRSLAAEQPGGIPLLEANPSAVEFGLHPSIFMTAS
jgi:hypothetical protein